MTDMALTALNYAIAEKLGWKRQEGIWIRPVSETAMKLQEMDQLPGDLTRSVVPRFSESIEAIWPAVEKLPKDISFGLLHVGPHWLCMLGREGDFRQEAVAETAPLAICRALLKLDLK